MMMKEESEAERFKLAPALLGRVMEETLAKELATYTANSQAFCLTKCEENVQKQQEMLLGVDPEASGYSGEQAVAGAKGVPESFMGQQMERVTPDSLVAMEKQCNKMCLRRMLTAFAHVHKVTRADDAGY